MKPPYTNLKPEQIDKLIATDEWGHRAVEDVVNHYDYHATLLHLFGLDHTRLTYKRAAQEQTLTDGQPGKVVKEILA